MGSDCNHIGIADVAAVGHAGSKQKLLVLQPAGKHCFCVTDMPASYPYPYAAAAAPAL